ncbi:hypothetical protein QJS04_geneDACA004810 [Acorus gramineus]|uniref:Fungal lipase-type domain-containing protein n=1 Tax=Acorus gramineus TaxID=55184 RepID=A0AAV9BW26_ACOGR|nr:hypothetical protein QJS04_geneDACA004810 [Acorus gramineus]
MTSKEVKASRRSELGKYKVSVVSPDKNSASYRSVLAFVDSRLDLFHTASSSNKVDKINNTFNAVEPFDLTMMASKIAYENPAFVQNAVEKHWKMHFVKFFSCWNEFYKANTTQAFICSDKAKDAQLIVLAFRGTEPFNSQDWATDVNLSWISTGKMGKVHMGFMKALGLTDERDFAKGFPAESPSKDPSKALAYYSIRDTLNALLKENPNAKVLITGHSLGGALATLFPALLLYHNQTTILNSLLHVFTFGQPRVGDEEFANFMASALMLRYRHIVYRYDIVPRVPLDLPPVSLFKHFGDCIYYSSWYVRKAVDEEPNKDYFSLKYIPSMHFHALVDLIRGVFAWLKPGVEFKEGLVSILFRAVGLLIPGLASHSPRDYVNGGRLSKFHAVDLI